MPIEIKDFGDNLIENIRSTKTSWWMPSLSEFITFVVLMSVLFLMVVFFHYSAIQKQVKMTSRCYSAKQKALVGGKYLVTANNQQNQPVYRVGYDLGAKSYTVDCACNPGNTPVTIPSIKVFNMRSMNDDYVKDKICQCDQYVYNPGDQLNYSGYPAIVRYMNTNDASFFTNKLI